MHHRADFAGSAMNHVEAVVHTRELDVDFESTGLGVEIVIVEVGYMLCGQYRRAGRKWVVQIRSNFHLGCHPKSSHSC